MIPIRSKYPFITTRLPLMAAVLIGTMVAVSATSALAVDALEQQQLVEKAKMTVDAFAADPEVGPATREMKSEAKALFIVPQFVRGAFVFGGAGGSGVLIVRDDKTKQWSEPAFYTIGSASFGLQIGGDVSELIFVVRTQKGLEEFYRTDYKLGADASVAMGSVGGGAHAKGITADVVAYAKKKGPLSGWQWMAPPLRCRMMPMLPITAKRYDLRTFSSSRVSAIRNQPTCATRPRS